MKDEIIIDNLEGFNDYKNNISYDKNNNLYYVLLSSGELEPLISPIDGSRLEPFKNTDYLISDNDLLYILINDGEIIPLLSNTNDFLIPSPVNDIFYGKNEKGSLFYKDSKGDIIRLLNPQNGCKLFLNENNEIVSYVDNNIYSLENGEIIIIKK